MVRGRSPSGAPLSKIHSALSGASSLGSDLIALHQIASRAETGPELTFSTIPGANDPMLQIAVRRPIDLSPSIWRRFARLAVQLAVCVFITALAGGDVLCRAALGVAARRPASRPPGARPSAIPDSSSSTGLRWDAISASWSSLCCRWRPVFTGHRCRCTRPQPSWLALPCSLSLGTGKAIRGDEWAYHTPAILHQVYRATPFDSETTPLGPDHTSLFSNIPVRHVTTIFRPQFWGFFVFPPAYAFSFYWQFKALLLLTGVFSVLLLLTQSSRIAAFGALWYAFSPNIQWTYSWPSLLPEMVGLFCIVMCAVFYMSVGRRPAMLVAAAAACAVGARTSHCARTSLIRFRWSGSECFSASGGSSRSGRSSSRATTRSHESRHSAGPGVSWAWPCSRFYVDAERALTTMANTLYPGRRSSPAGGYSMLAMSSHFFSFWENDQRLPLPQVSSTSASSPGFSGWRPSRSSPCAA